ncbi:hypothetical protein TRIUR3_28538 [Triticum urartu]|uniref:Uncharacterized protein n=1 Tax=Triticum urartu TaxID=4572 RepID=M7ZRV0_TRIUA|nr:hypothetical protein TRIUR3_28538 [Triticum urartu]
MTLGSATPKGKVGGGEANDIVISQHIHVPTWNQLQLHLQLSTLYEELSKSGNIAKQRFARKLMEILVQRKCGGACKIWWGDPGYRVPTDGRHGKEEEHGSDTFGHGLHERLGGLAAAARCREGVGRGVETSDKGNTGPRRRSVGRPSHGSSEGRRPRHDAEEAEDDELDVALDEDAAGLWEEARCEGTPRGPPNVAGEVMRSTGTATPLWNWCRHGRGLETADCGMHGCYDNAVVQETKGGADAGAGQRLRTKAREAMEMEARLEELAAELQRWGC